MNQNAADVYMSLFARRHFYKIPMEVGMLTSTDFDKKQIVFVFLNQGEKLSFSNDNFVVKTSDGKIKFQCTCYRLFIVFAVGHGSITSGLIQKAKKHRFSIVMLTQSLRPYQVINAMMEGNTLLRKKQYNYDSLELARHITCNKIANQRELIRGIRNKNEKQEEAINLLEAYISRLPECSGLHEIMGYEGSASKVYFSSFFNNIVWKGRAPRTKCDMINTLLDIGYTILFSFIEALLVSYGFDIYCGVMHRNFYMRKSLVCDIIEPFRVLIDAQVRKSINLKQFNEADFIKKDNRFLLKWTKNSDYISILAKPIVENKIHIHAYIQQYYRSFMKHKPINEYPVFKY